MPDSLTSLMESGDPMLSAVQNEPSPLGAAAPLGPPPPMNTQPISPPSHQQLQAMMQPSVPTPRPRPNAATDTSMTPDLKDAFVVALVAFVVLLPNVQALLSARLGFMSHKTTATLVNAALMAVAFYFLKEHILGLL